MGRSAKGSAFERWLCRRLSVWWTHGERDDVFWRTPGSGGRATNRARLGKSTKNHSSDVLASDPIGQPFLDLFSPEAKRGYNRVTPFDIIDKPDRAAKQVWEEWVQQATDSMLNSGAHSWLIVHKRDKRKAMAFLPTVDFYRVMDVQKSFAPDRGLIQFSVGANGEIDVIGMTLDALLGSITPRGVRRVLRKLKGDAA